MDEIKPVAWVCDSEFFNDQQMAQVHRHFRLRKGFSAELLPLYDQQAIDTLRAEVAEAWAAADSKAGWEWKKRAERAEAEAEALRKDAERYRWLRLALLGAEDDPIDHLLLEKEPETDAEFDAAVDAAIDAAKQAAE